MDRAAIEWVLAVVAMACCAPAAAQEAAGTIKRLDGSARIVSAGGAERAVAVGEAIHSGERIATSPDSAVGMTLADGTLLSVGPNASVALRRFAYDPTTREGSVLIDIARGALRMVSGLIARSDPRQVELHTPTSTVGIRGTDVLVDVGDASPAR